MDVIRTLLLTACLITLFSGCAKNPLATSNTSQTVYTNIVRQIDESESLPYLFKASAYMSYAYELKLRSGGMTRDLYDVVYRARENFNVYQSYKNKKISFEGVCGVAYPSSVEHEIEKAVQLDLPSNEKVKINIKVVTGLDTTYPSPEGLKGRLEFGYRRCSEFVDDYQPIGQLLNIESEQNAPIYSLTSEDWFQPYWAMLN